MTHQNALTTQAKQSAAARHKQHLLLSLLIATGLASCQSPVTPAAQPSESSPAVETRASAQSWTLSTLAGRNPNAEFFFGHQDGQGAQSLFYNPSSLALSPEGHLLVMDRFNYVVREVKIQAEPEEAVQVSTYWGTPGERGNRDGNGQDGRINQALGLNLSSTGELYIADAQNHSIRKITPDGKLSTLAGTGAEGYRDEAGESAKFNWPGDLALDEAQNLYVTDRFNHAIRKITPEGQVSTLAGGSGAGYNEGTGREASFNEPMGIVYHDGALYVADSKNHRIRKVSLQGVTHLVAGSGQEGSRDDSGPRAEFRAPAGLDFDSQGNLYVADRMNHRIRKITPTGEVSSIAGEGRADFANGNAGRLNFPFDVAVANDKLMYIADYSNHAIRKLTRAQ